MKGTYDDYERINILERVMEDNSEKESFPVVNDVNRGRSNYKQLYQIPDKLNEIVL